MPVAAANSGLAAAGLAVKTLARMMLAATAEPIPSRKNLDVIAIPFHFVCLPHCLSAALSVEKFATSGEMLRWLATKRVLSMPLF